MKTISISTALAMSALVLAGFCANQAQAAKGPQLSGPVNKVLVEEQKLEKAGDLKSALDKIHEAQALPDRTPYDDYTINEILVNIASASKDTATLITAYEAMADSPALPDEERTHVWTNAVLLATQGAHYQKALAYADQLAKLGPVPDKIVPALSQCHYFLKDYAGARDLSQKAIATAKAANQVPERALYQILEGAQEQLGDKAGSYATLEELATAYGQPDDWSLLVRIGLGTKEGEMDALNLFRLARAAGASLDEGDYTMIADIALHNGYPGEAMAAVQHGGHAPDARAKAAQDEKSLPSQEAAGKAQGGEYNVKLAEDYLGYSRYAEAEAAARRAIAKGGMKNPSEGDMVLGIALVGEGKYADAQQAFQRVQGTASALRAARYWGEFAKFKASPPPASPQ